MCTSLGFAYLSDQANGSSLHGKTFWRHWGSCISRICLNGRNMASKTMCSSEQGSKAKLTQHCPPCSAIVLMHLSNSQLVEPCSAINKMVVFLLLRTLWDLPISPWKIPKDCVTSYIVPFESIESYEYVSMMLLSTIHVWSMLGKRVPYIMKNQNSAVLWGEEEQAVFIIIKVEPH